MLEAQIGQVKGVWNAGMMGKAIVVLAAAGIVTVCMWAVKKIRK